MSSSSVAATRCQQSAVAQILVPLREQGDLPPLFHMPAGYGDMRFFQQVADGIDNRPVYGLQPPGLKLVAGIRQKPLRWLVGEYILEIKRIQETGPYCLSGYSGGGLLMVETAKTLIDAGDDVALVAVMDPPLQVPRWLTFFYMSLYRLCNLTQATDDIRWRIIRNSNNRLLRWVSDEGMCTHMAIFKDLEVRSYPGRITYIRPEKSWIRLLNLTRIGRSGLDVAKHGTETFWTPGTHHTMLLQGQVEFVTAIVNDCRARGRSTDRTAPMEAGFDAPK